MCNYASLVTIILKLRFNAYFRPNCVCCNILVLTATMVCKNCNIHIILIVHIQLNNVMNNPITVPTYL